MLKFNSQGWECENEMSFSSGIFLIILSLKVDGDDMKMKKRRRR